MKVKVNKEQLEAIVWMLELLLAQYPPENIAEELVNELVDKVYTKLYTKSRRLVTGKNGWSFTLTDLEARAMHLFCQNTAIDAQKYAYEAIQMQRMFNEIDRNYGRTNPKNQRNRALATGTPPRRLGGQAR